jgi:2-polyprenyl-6-methoxyphenol hydroxylase-like FAD-dependent oxidoreductase
METIVEQTTCVVVGGGPAGAVLSFMLARNGVSVTLLEAHKDFDRDYRGDTLHPSILEIMDELGLAESLLQLPHTKLHKLTTQTPNGPVEIGDFSHLKTKFPYIALMPQSRFLAFVTKEAKRFSHFRLVMGARVDELLENKGVVAGVRYQGSDGIHDVQAVLTVGADGRYSQIRKLGGFQAVKSAPSIDLLWFRLTRKPDDPPGLMGRFGNGHVLIQLERGDQWQCGFSIPKGAFSQLRAAGLEALREAVSATAPELSDRVAELQDWKQISLLSVDADYVPCWYKPGLLLIGDAAHVMSPVGGNGINYAIQDAVVTANTLSAHLKAGHVSEEALAKVQHQRERAVKTIQAAVNVIHRILPTALVVNKRLTGSNVSAKRATMGGAALAGLMNLAQPIVNAFIIPKIAFGILPVHVKQTDV